jgi:secreted PhoX family phosphatase
VSSRRKGGSRGSERSLFSAVLAARLDRRGLLGGGLSASLLAFLDGCATSPYSFYAPPAPSTRLLGFSPVPASRDDAVVVPAGYGWRLVNAWGDPIRPGGPAFRPDASQSAAEQAQQSGMHHDGMMFFPLPRGMERSDHGLLAVNFEYTDDNLLTTQGMEPWTAEKSQKSRNAHGLGVFEVRLDGERWLTVPDSRYGRRITADTPLTLTGPAAGHPLLQTALDPAGRTVRGTFANCACGRTPWGTYLACEENFAPYFVNDSGKSTRLADRYAVPTTAASWGYRWQLHDERFDAGRHPHEPHRFGWVVELDPYDPDSTPVKRTALGRMAHEGATVAIGRNGRVVVYMGDDDFRSKFEHIYKFVSRDPFSPRLDPQACRQLLDEGTLYAARFDADGTGRWLPLRYGDPGLGPGEGFASQADVLVGARLAADALGATFMDRPEWIAVHPRTREVYCSLTNNSARGSGKPPGHDQPLGPDAANRRAPNTMGHIIRWHEAGDDPAGTRFRWDIFLEAGDPALHDRLKQGNVKGGVAFSQPDGLVFDERGVLWIQTDASAQNVLSEDWARIGNNQLLAADPGTGEVRRFLTGPVGCEITGVTFTPDQRTMFVNIQHPGESPDGAGGRNDPRAPKAHSSWPDGARGGRPRSATIAIRRNDGGVIGT